MVFCFISVPSPPVFAIQPQKPGWGGGGGGVVVGGGTSGSEVFMKQWARMGGCRFIKGDPA